MNKFIALAAFAPLAALGQATTLDSTLSVDNSYHLYLSTSDAALGTLIGSGSDWTQSNTFTGTSLSAGQDYFLHVVGQNQGEFNSGNPAAFIGQFTLNGSDHVFANGGSTLKTGDAAWSVNNVGFGSPMVATTSFATNGSGIWGGAAAPIAGVGNAQWIWSADGGANATGYFSTKVQAVPEPASMLTFAGAAVGYFRRRNKKRA